MKKTFLFTFVLFIFPAVILAEDPGDIARRYFAEALIHWGRGEFVEARESLAKAMAGEVYLEDIPEFWYFLAKMDLEEGEIRKAREELNNVSLFAYRPEVAYLSEVIDTILERRVETPKITDVEEAMVIEGFQNDVELFYTPVSADLFDERLLVLDGTNDRLAVVDSGGVKIWSLKTLGLNECRDLVVDKLTGWMYISTKTGTIWRVKDFSPSGVERIGDGYIFPQLAGTDRIGRIYVLDTGRSKVNILDYNGNKKMELSPEQGFAPLLSITKNAFNVALFDAEKNQILSFDRFGNLVDMFSPPDGAHVKSIALDPFGNFFLLDGRGKVHFKNVGSDEWNHVEYPRSFDGIRFSFPYLIAWSIRDNQVVLFNTNYSTVSMNLYIHSIQVKPQVEITLTYGVMLITGDPVLSSSRFTEVYDSGGRVTAELIFERITPQIHHVSSDNDFNQLLPLLDRGSPNIVFLETDDSSLPLETIFPLLLKNVALFTTCEELTELARMSGGDFVAPEEVPELAGYLQQVRWPEMKAVYSVTPPISAGIKAATVLIKMSGLEYSDTIYYLREMLQSGFTEEGTSVKQSGE